MATEDQTEVVRFLSSPSTHGGIPVETIETHASIVFLAGDRAWKLKRAVRYDYLDFSTVERRKAMCEAELRINRRTAPEIYRGVTPVIRTTTGALSLGGSGTAVDWLVEMVRFDQNGLLDRLAERHVLDETVMVPLASAISRLHQLAERRDDHGGAASVAWVINGNATGFAEQGRGILDARSCASLSRDVRIALDRHAALLDARRDRGFVRQCHGDLHLRNIVLIDGRPTLFDAIEFNDEISCIDVFYDLAFLLMDLWRRNLPRHANAVWNEYLSQTGDFEAVALAPLFLSCRAAVRAKTSATAASLRTGPEQSDLQQVARDYLGLAHELLHPPAPCLIAVGGLSGSGKSTLARALAPTTGPVPGAVVVRSDEIRKRLCGVEPLEKLGPEGYTTDVSRRVYETVIDRASRIVRAGHSAIADAVFSDAVDRDAIERAAQAAGASFIGLWLEAPESSLIARSNLRRNDASDADAAVIRRQLALDTRAVRWHRLDASGSSDRVLGEADRTLRGRLTNDIVRSGTRWR